MELKQPHVVRDGFEGVDRALFADERRQQERVVAEMGPHVEANPARSN